jgi:ABC-type bacteriocin/lantibiotic exporter with double-glycine peptidase domain
LEAVEQWFVKYQPKTFKAKIVLLGAIVFMFWSSWVLTLYSIGAVAFIALVGFLILRPVVKRRNKE